MNFQCSTFARFSCLFSWFNDERQTKISKIEIRAIILPRVHSPRFERPSKALSEPFYRFDLLPEKTKLRFLSRTPEEARERRSENFSVARVSGEFTFYGNLAFSCALAAFFFSQCQKWSQFNVYTIKTNIKGHKGSKKRTREKTWRSTT